MSGGSSNKFVSAAAPNVEVYESAFAQAKVSVCHVQAPPIPPDTVGLQGTADLYELAEGVFTVATNNHVIPITDADFLVNTVFTFEGLGPIRLSKEEIKFCTTNKELDATVIELTDAGVKRLQQFGAKFIRVTTLVVATRYRRRRILHWQGSDPRDQRQWSILLFWRCSRQQRFPDSPMGLQGHRDE